MKSKRSIRIKVEPKDALEFEVDVLALKYAQALYGVDDAVYQRMVGGGVKLRLPKIGRFTLLSSEGRLAARSVLFVGVKPLGLFGYPEIRDFGRRVLVYLAGEAPQTRRLALTLHGRGYGLDEMEAFEAELGGLLDAVTSGKYPDGLETISFLERDSSGARRLRASLRQLLPEGVLPFPTDGSVVDLEHETQNTLRNAGYAAASKPNVFVAMPFAEAMDDVFHFGIQGAVKAAGLLCERADLSTFTGDIMDWVKRRIASASLVVADLSTANPNVYLEVGYAWGCRVPTVLLIKDTAELKFDVRGHRCIVYKSIKQLQEALGRELQRLSHSSAGSSAQADV